jgi:hypothetical protein
VLDVGSGVGIVVVLGQHDEARRLGFLGHPSSISHRDAGHNIRPPDALGNGGPFQHDADAARH